MLKDHIGYGFRRDLAGAARRDGVDLSRKSPCEGHHCKTSSTPRHGVAKSRTRRGGLASRYPILSLPVMSCPFLGRPQGLTSMAQHLLADGAWRDPRTPSQRAMPGSRSGIACRKRWCYFRHDTSVQLACRAAASLILIISVCCDVVVRSLATLVVKSGVRQSRRGAPFRPGTFSYDSFLGIALPKRSFRHSGEIRRTRPGALQ